MFVKQFNLTIYIHVYSSPQTNQSFLMRMPKRKPTNDGDRPKKKRKKVRIFLSCCFKYFSYTVYISCSRLYRLLCVYKICRFLWLKFEFPITFFSIGPIYMIFMKDIEGIWNFQTPTKKRLKRVKKGQNLKFCKNVKILNKTLFFLKFTLCVPL